MLFGFVVLVAAVLGSGCTTTRSISNAGYDDNGGGYYYGRSGNPFYRGELNEFDLLGIESGSAVTDEQIGRTLDRSGRVTLRKGSSVLLIQSGAMQPDKPMSDATGEAFRRGAVQRPAGRDERGGLRTGIAARGGAGGL